MSKHNHSYIQPSTGTYISGIFFKTKNCPFSISKTTDKSNKNKTTLIFFPQENYTLVIYVSGMKFCLKMIYDRTNIYLVCIL